MDVHVQWVAGGHSVHLWKTKQTHGIRIAPQSLCSLTVAISCMSSSDSILNRHGELQQKFINIRGNVVTACIRIYRKCVPI